MKAALRKRLAIESFALTVEHRDPQRRGEVPSYITVRDGKVRLSSGSGTPLALANITTGCDAMALELSLEDARSPEQAVRICDKLLPRYMSGPLAPQSVYIVRVFKPTE